MTIDELKNVVQGKGEWKLKNYYEICFTFLTFIEATKPTRIISPFRQNQHYIFYQYGTEAQNKITRPLNTNLFFESPQAFKDAFERLMVFLADLRLYQESVREKEGRQAYLETREINKVVYTMQQAIGCIGDAFENPNQSRKRIGQLFETLIKLLIQEVGLICEPRTVNIPIPDYPGYSMSYELDVVFSRNKAILTAESEHRYVHPSEIVGSVKTTSKDRIDGVYYVDPRPEMMVNERLREQIRDFQRFLTEDLWLFSR